ncbi:permease-like cell division protein FtsX [Cohnella faecalis]|uniref:Cell division protein FtsX n=1 Tax=Cohnella faecalis TaxID=2315694 RepID=A0A398CIC1_9BACL|nr:permease-like cell division protein FtsX [Cohnella faecalis]RIE02115.1 ABC transporter permease [Cohnella faecalis]
MIFNSVVRHLREGGKNVARNGWMSFASMSSIGVSLFILGVFLLLAINVNKLADQIEQQVQIRVYLKLDTEQAKIDEIERQIKRIPEVKSVTFVSKEEGLERLRKNLGDNGSALQGYEDDKNPLPDGFDVEVFSPQKIDFAAKQITALNGKDPEQSIWDVKYGEETVKKLFKITNAVRNIGLVIVLGLAVMAMFLISTTIKMTILARRREISIMKMVGATNSFIRWPFFIEGVLIGIIGSVITVALLLYGYARIVSTSKVDMGLMMIELSSVNEVAWTVGGTIVGIGILLGVWGSVISVRKYLKV